MKEQHVTHPDLRLGKSTIRFVLFMAFYLFAMLGNWGYLDFFVEMHEQGHLTAYEREGIKCWRKDFYTVTSTKRTWKGLISGTGAVINFTSTVFLVVFAISGRHYWLCGAPLGFLTYLFWMWYSEQDRLVDIGVNLDEKFWITYGFPLFVCYFLFIFWKIGPEIQEYQDGYRKNIIFKKREPQKHARFPFYH